MPRLNGTKQGIVNTTADPVIGIRVDTGFLRDLIGDTKSHTGDIVRHLVGVGLQQVIDSGAVGIIDLHGQIQGNAVLLEKDHGLTLLPLFCHLNRDLSCAVLADAPDFRQSLRFFINDAQRIFLEFLYDSCSQRRTHTLNRAGTEITFDGDHIFGSCYFIAFHIQLLAIHRMLGKCPIGFLRFTFTDVGHISHESKAALIRGQLQYGITVF